MWCFVVILVLIHQGWCFSNCPQYWVPIEQSCYALLHDKTSWASADEFCKDMSGYLAEITSPEEQTAVIRYLEAKNSEVRSVWLGGTDILHDGTWFWMNSKDPITTSSWGAGQPDNFHGENCLHLNKYANDRWSWNDIDCSSKFYGLCETDLPGPAVG